MRSVRHLALLAIIVAPHIGQGAEPGASMQRKCVGLLQNMVKRLHRTKGIPTVFDEKSVDPKFAATYSPRHGAILQNPNLSATEQLQYQFHESVHAAVDFEILNSYSPKRAALGIVFRKDGGAPLSERLPRAYQYYLSRDEGVAYRKGAAHVARVLKDNPQAAEQVKLAEAIERTSAALLFRLEKAIVLEQSGGEAISHIRLAKYRDGARDLKYAVFEIWEKDLSVLEIAVPIKIEGTAPPSRRKLQDLAIEVIRAGR